MPNRTVAALSIIAALLPAAAAAADKPVRLEARLGQPVMKAGETQKNYLRVALNGCEAKRKDDRTPVNVAFVIDRSGSMEGARIEQAREAAIMAVNRLDQGDIASVVIFDDKVNVLIPSQPVNDRAMFAKRIREVAVGDSTAIYDGVMEGAREVRKSKDARRLNRVVLLSDGQANVGPSRPADFARLGRDLLGEGISVSTIGLGLDYNEDLMLQLARASDGNHAFANAPDDLIQIFNHEFDDVLAACAQTVSIDVEVGSGVKLTRALSREGDVQGDRAAFKMNQIYAATEHYVLLELEVEGARPADERDLGRIHVSYTVPDTGAREVIEAPIRGRFSASADEVKNTRDQTVMVAVVEQTARARAQEAVKLRDEGKHTEAAKLFQQNVEEIQTIQGTLPQPSKVLDGLQRQYDRFSKTTPVAPASQLMMERKALRQMDSGSNSGGSRF